MDIALTREVSPEMGRCELTFLEREAIDYGRAVEQHQQYCDLLRSLGLEVLSLAAAAEYPDCCFVEDTAVVLDEVAVLTTLGAPARRGESPAIEQALAPYRRIARMRLPATLDGGDVLQVGRTLFVGLTQRTTAAGIDALSEIVAPLGYEVVPVRVRGCLHLKSAATLLDEDTLLANPEWLDLEPLSKLTVVPVPREEPGAANVLRVRDEVLAHAGFPRTIDLITGRGIRVTALDLSEFLKAEAGLTCKSLLFRRS